MNQSVFGAIFLGLLWSPSNHAATTADIPVAYLIVAGNFEVPADILFAVALTESGRLYQGNKVPWPWALNISGEAHYCETRERASIVITEAIQQGKSVDIGLMQVNWRWHKQRFLNVEDSLSPMNNLSVGATILAEQYQQSGDWWEAVGRYHDPGRDNESLDSAERYRERVKQNWQGWF